LGHLRYRLRYISCGVGLLSSINVAGSPANALAEIIEFAGVQSGCISANISSEENKSPGAFFVGSSTLNSYGRNFFENLAPLGTLIETPPGLNANSGNRIVVWVFQPDNKKCFEYYLAMQKLPVSERVFPAKFFEPVSAATTQEHPLDAVSTL
jgi:hypothetical protein